jgi:hypothetical protein
MLKPNFINIVFYFFLKYIVFYFFIMFKNNDFTFIQINELRGFNDLFLYLWMFSFLPIVCSIIFGIPLFLVFRSNNNIYFIVLVSAFIVAEYFLYTYFASQLDFKNGIYNGILTLLFFILFFYKQIAAMFRTTNL